MTTSSIPLYEAMSTLRAVRKLRTDPIPDDVLKRILQAAAWAPSGGNVQPWRIVAVRDQQRRRLAISTGRNGRPTENCLAAV
jgi:nitroreductase